MTEFEMLLACYRSGQVSERQWQEHLKDRAFRAWAENQKSCDELTNRVERFRGQGLPGQPAHMGTLTLVNDLHAALVEARRRLAKLEAET